MEPETQVGESMGCWGQVGNGMGYGVWGMVYGVWCMVYGETDMLDCDKGNGNTKGWVGHGIGM